MSRVNLNVSVRLVRFPRVSGDEPLNAVAGGNKETFSPRERG